MTDDLEIIDVQISPPKLTKPEKERGEQQPWVDITITIKNHSSENTYYVISSLRTRRYDSSTRTLFVGLSEPEPIPEIPLPHKFPPKMISVLPGESAVLKVSVPLVLKEIRPSGGLAMNVETFDISDLKHINCIVSFSEAEFHYVPSDSTERMIKKLLAWGKTTDKTFDRRIVTDKQKKSSYQKSKK